MKFRYYVAKRFFPDEQYNKFALSKNRKEIVTLDSILCKQLNVIDIFIDNLYGRTNDVTKLSIYKIKDDEQILQYFKNPTEKPIESEYGFEFCGYDLMDKLCDISSITNCGDGVSRYINSDLFNEYGLIKNLNYALKIKNSLEENEPLEFHSICDIYAVWRKF